MIKTLHLRVEGRVQGVFYRQSVMDAIVRLGGISGWVRNRADGSVEVFGRAEESLLDKMRVICEQGSTASFVTAIEALPVDDVNLPAIEDGVFRKEKTV